MFLHEDKELFRDVIEATAEELKRPTAIVEKDYYVTMILKLLSEKAPECVFKGGTSLSKCHHAIDRFSEDIDIAFSNADKVFAICDYYLSGKIQRNSRHIYDLYMLLPKLTLDASYKKLVAEIREQRAGMSICLSAKRGVNISDILKRIIKDEVYRSDYEEITTYFQNHPVEYEEVIDVLEKIIQSKIFE